MHDIFIWGSGSLANSILNETNTLSEYNVIGVIDNDSKKWSTSFHGYLVYSPSVIETISSDGIVILVEKIDEIKEQIKENYPLYKGKIEDKMFFIKESILKRYESTDDKEIIRVCEYIKQNGLDVFNYPFIRLIHCSIDEILYDDNKDMYYTKIGFRKLYFSRNYKNKEMAWEYYRSLLMEQNEESPHRYLDKDFDVDHNSIVVDVGAAEGFFSIEIIDRVKKLYLIEPDESWIDALQYTFSSEIDKKKITIIPKFASSFSFGKCITLDSVIKEPVDFIKMDIEGCEWDALLGCRDLFQRSNKIKAAICAYHTDYDEELIKNKLFEYKMNCKTTEGYMYFPYRTRTNYPSTKLHHGIIRAKKNEEYL